MTWEILLGRPVRAVVTVMSMLWFTTIAAMTNRLYLDVVPIAASCLEASGGLFSPFLSRFIDLTMLVIDYWLPLIVVIPLVAIAPKQRVFAVVPFLLLALVVVWQVVAAWASSELARVTVDCLVDAFVTNPRAGQ